MAKEKFEILESTCVPLPLENVDTDQIIPARFLKATSRLGFGDNLFRDWRYNNDNSPKTGFPLNESKYKGEILVAGKNFGCGSSREHAPWALLDFGFRVLIAPGFADIFYNNCYQNGILPIVLPTDVVDRLFVEAKPPKRLRVTVDLGQQQIVLPDGDRLEFELDAFRKQCLLQGLDDISLTLEKVEQIRTYERQRQKVCPWLFADLL